MNVKHCLKCSGNGYYYNGVSPGRYAPGPSQVDIEPDRVTCERCDGSGHIVVMGTALRALEGGG